MTPLDEALGVGASIVPCSGRVARGDRCDHPQARRCELDHSALAITGDDGPYLIEMAPVPDELGDERGLVAQGAVAQVG